MNALISDKYEDYKAECNQRFDQLKANEEELNRIFIGHLRLAGRAYP